VSSDVQRQSITVGISTESFECQIFVPTPPNLAKNLALAATQSHQRVSKRPLNVLTSSRTLSLVVGDLASTMAYNRKSLVVGSFYLFPDCTDHNFTSSSLEYIIVVPSYPTLFIIVPTLLKMMIQHLAILSLLAGATAAETKPRYGAKKRSEFFAAMKSANLNAEFAGRKLQEDQTPSLDTFAEYLHGDSDKSRNLRKKIMNKAKYVSPEEIKEREARKLENQYVNSKYNYNNEAGTELYSQKDGADDYFVASGAWNNAFGFDVTQYSFSYHRCAEVRQFDNELAAMEDSNTVFNTKHFAVFRFCPSKTCEGMTEEQIEAERQEEYAEYMKNLSSQNAANQAAAYAEARSGNVNAFSAYAANQYIQQQAEEARLNGEQYEPPSWVFDKRIIGGANGSGCSSNYGEYMLELEGELCFVSFLYMTFIYLLTITSYAH
jgi:hypothetical protein